MNFYIFRHGKTAFSGTNLEYEDQVETAPVLPEGVPPLEQLGKYLKDIPTDFNVSSVFLRCQQTVDIVSTISGKRFEFDILLHDIDYRFETEKDVAKRITEFYDKLVAQKHSSVAICTHGYPISMLKYLILEGKVNMSKLMDFPKTGVLLSIEDGKVSYKDFN